MGHPNQSFIDKFNIVNKMDDSIPAPPVLSVGEFVSLACMSKPCVWLKIIGTFEYKHEHTLMCRDVENGT